MSPFWCYRMKECRSVTRRLDRFIHRIPLADRLDIFNNIEKGEKDGKQ